MCFYNEFLSCQLPSTTCRYGKYQTMTCHTLSEVITTLDRIVAECTLQNSALGYFATLYRRVTLRVKAGILQEEFADNVRMETLVVLFANRYFAAYEGYRQQLPVTDSWKVAFEATQASGPIIMQHLLLGINAHINLDLGISAVEAAGDAPLETVKKGFDDINRVLSELVEEVKAKMSTVSPAFGFLMPLARKTDEKLVQFSIQTARDGAWRFAQRLRGEENRSMLVALRDQDICLLGGCLARPNRRLGWILRVIAWLEWRSVAANLRLLQT